MSILLGQLEKEEKGFESNPYCYEGTGQVLTICPDSSIKDEHIIIPNLLNYKGSIIILDPSGEYYKRTFEHRANLGHKIIKLDPFGITGGTSDTFNPLDILQFNQDSLIDVANILVENFTSEQSLKSIFWDNQAHNLLVAVILYFAQIKKEEASFKSILDLLTDDDVVYNLAVVLDTIGGKIHPMAYKYIANFLKEGDLSRNGILHTIIQHFLFLYGDLTKSSLLSTSFELQDLISGNPYTIYISIPITKSKSHEIVTRLWLSSFALLLTETKYSDNIRTLFILESELGINNHPYIQNLHQHPSKANVQLWTFWKNIFDIQNCFPKNWKSRIVNSEIIQIIETDISIFDKELNSSFSFIKELDKKSYLNKQIVICGQKSPLILSIFGVNLPDHFNQNSNLKSNLNNNKQSNSVIAISTSELNNFSSLQINELINYRGSIISFNTNTGFATASIEQRQKLGNQIIKLDPFNTLGKDNDTFNPLDILWQNSKLSIDNVYTFLANNFNKQSNDDLFWDRHSKFLLTGLILYKFHLSNNKKVNFNSIKDLFTKDLYSQISLFADEVRDIDYNTWKLLLASKNVRDIVSEKSKGNFIDICESYLSGIDTPYSRRSLSSTSFDLDSLKSGQPFSIYITIPASKLKSHGVLLRLWISSLIQFIGDMEESLPNKVLFMLNHAPYVGDIPFYQSIQSNSKNKNFQLWTFWDSLGQIQKHYPKEWKSILGNSSIIQALGIQNPIIAEEMSSVFGISTQELKSIPSNKHLIVDENNKSLQINTILK